MRRPPVPVTSLSFALSLILASSVVALPAATGAPAAAPGAKSSTAPGPARTAATPAAPAQATPAGTSKPPAAAPQVATLLMDDFRKVFAADAGRLRLLLLFSPTCPQCLKGAGEVSELLARISSPDLRVYVVWVPVLKNDTEERAAETAALITDPRATHFWNADNSMPREAARALHVQNQLDVAWDVFLLYSPESAWLGPSLFPQPAAWMHRLHPNDQRWMTPEKLELAIQALLPAAAK